MSAPEVSICLPVFNSSERIERCLRAVIAQHGPSREILVVDNASTDDTVVKARAMLSGVAGARVVVNDRNIGRIENWNRCLEMAEGNYIKFALVNDVLLPGSVAMLLQAAKTEPNAVMICSYQRNMDAMPEFIEPVSTNPKMEIYDSAGALGRMARNGNDTGAPGGMLIRADVVRRDSLRFRTDIPFWSDFHFAIELAERGKVVYVDAASYLFDLSVTGRYANTGLKNYYGEGAICARALAARLPKFGVEGWKGYEFLYRQYTGQVWNYRQPALGLGATRRLFAGAGPYRARAARYAVRQRARMLWERSVHYATRAAAKTGLYRYSWEKK
ncbi:MAG TPA: glycosyltransferase family A protein [Opitutales bacterium]|jgi:glycosyltransferase involved in cell wall biosynthesis|nr:glycosyltransferase family A protein [Opitutales bacterium]